MAAKRSLFQMTLPTGLNPPRERGAPSSSGVFFMLAQVFDASAVLRSNSLKMNFCSSG